MGPDPPLKWWGENHHTSWWCQRHKKSTRDSCSTIYWCCFFGGKILRYRAPQVLGSVRSVLCALCQKNECRDSHSTRGAQCFPRSHVPQVGSRRSAAATPEAACLQEKAGAQRRSTHCTGVRARPRKTTVAATAATATTAAATSATTATTVTTTVAASQHNIECRLTENFV